MGMTPYTSMNNQQARDEVEKGTNAWSRHDGSVLASSGKTSDRFVTLILDFSSVMKL